MNDLKFRWFEKEGETIIYPSDFSDMWFVEVDEDGLTLTASDAEFTGFYAVDSVCMQSAQCTDDHGTDIYAGDILAGTDECDDEVVYFEVRFCRGGYGNILGFYFYEAGGKDGRSIPSEFNLKVVGNIYENKELLGGTE